MSGGDCGRLIRRARRRNTVVIKRLVHPMDGVHGVIDRDERVGKPDSRTDRGLAAVGDNSGRRDRIPVRDDVLRRQTIHRKKRGEEQQSAKNSHTILLKRRQLEYSATGVRMTWEATGD